MLMSKIYGVVQKIAINKYTQKIFILNDYLFCKESK